jgi:chromate transport protein ChrA
MTALLLSVFGIAGPAALIAACSEERFRRRLLLCGASALVLGCVWPAVFFLVWLLGSFRPLGYMSIFREFGGGIVIGIICRNAWDRWKLARSGGKSEGLPQRE